MALRITVSGATGRMGRALGRLMAEAEDLEAAAGIAPDGDQVEPQALGYPSILPVDHAGQAVRDCDVLIDFSAPDHLQRILDLHDMDLAGRALLVGTTGIDGELESRLHGLAARAAVILAPNFSLGVNVLLALVERAAAALPADGFDVEIVETHHGRKEDAPSGTALALGRAVAAGRGDDLDALRRDGRTGRPGPRPTGEIGFHALRGGGVAGEHIVHFLGAGERITLGHNAESRDLFAEGALAAARWVAGRGPGRYTMAQVVGLED